MWKECVPQSGAWGFGSGGQENPLTLGNDSFRFPDVFQYVRVQYAYLFLIQYAPVDSRPLRRQQLQQN